MLNIEDPPRPRCQRGMWSTNFRTFSKHIKSSEVHESLKGIIDLAIRIEKAKSKFKEKST